MRRHFSGVGCGARGHGETSPRTRAAPGLRPGPLRVPARSWLTAGRSGLPEARTERLTQKAPRSSGRRQDKAVRGQSAARRRSENAAMAHRKAPRTANGACTRRKVAPVGAPSPSA